MKSAPLLICLLLTACDQIVELDGSKAAEADGKAVGGACRHAGAATKAPPSADPYPTGIRPDKRTGPAADGRTASAAPSAANSGVSEIPGPAAATALPPGFPGNAPAH